ncbi:pyridoxamine 5'-phosphate oxidase family protein [Sediminicoccus sp. KRV36]|uniref:pyridoxamine 5'-phosphate oxidase family protein n=1 Tax=Sediminicoccus sp. KRV36 TaxID=3133721 RepID=UPI00200C80A6|nr:pyridoxamine 5'-phosphate oxidase family protein [Sediminicoccus rosea]UPY38816.1 pyridoxamine 5'-phosphate oxidase family protein [Sediminicoccus rosea]
MSHPRPRPGHADDLMELRAAAFELLARGVADRRSPVHTPTLASIGLDGTPRARTLVLRGFDAAARTLRLHSDQRGEKFAELARDPRFALHAYDPAAQVQLRLQGVASLHTDDAVAEAAWQASQPFSRICYSIEPAPGTPIAAPMPAPQDEVVGRQHFGVILLRMHSLEWLWLAAEGHRRARLDWPDGEERATWLVP